MGTHVNVEFYAAVRIDGHFRADDTDTMESLE